MSVITQPKERDTYRERGVTKTKCLYPHTNQSHYNPRHEPIPLNAGTPKISCRMKSLSSVEYKSLARNKRKKTPNSKRGFRPPKTIWRPWYTEDNEEIRADSVG